MEIFKKIPLVMAEIGAIGKDRKNQQQGYSFRGIDDIYNAVNAALAKHGVFCTPSVEDMKREERQTQKGGTLFYTILTVKYVFYASDGSSIEVRTVGEAMDSGDKSCNKAMSAAQKYAFLQVFCIPTEEPKDTENETYTGVKVMARLATENNPAFLKSMDAQKARLGAKYLELLGALGYENAEQITDRDEQKKIYYALTAEEV